MTGFESTRNLRYAVQTVVPLRPAPLGNRRLVRFLALTLVSLLVVLLALNLFTAMGAPKGMGITLAMGWMIIVTVCAGLTLLRRARDERAIDRNYTNWESDARRLAIDRLGLDLSAGRVPQGLQMGDVQSLEGAATDWRHGREALESLTWATGHLARTRDDLRNLMDEAMANLLAEAGASSSLGLSPFALERARTIFLEIGREANQIATTNACPGKFATDDSIEAMRPALERLRATRVSSTEPHETPDRVGSREEAG